MTTQDKEVVLTVNISKGWKDGTQLVFPKEGDQGPNKIPGKTGGNE